MAKAKSKRSRSSAMRVVAKKQSQRKANAELRNATGEAMDFAMYGGSCREMKEAKRRVTRALSIAKRVGVTTGTALSRAKVANREVHQAARNLGCKVPRTSIRGGAGSAYNNAD